MAAVIDWNDLMERLGDEELIEEIVPEFLDEDSKYIEKITTAINSADPEAVANSAHALKGAASSIGAIDLAESAKEIEALGKSGDISTIDEIFTKLKEQFEEVETLLNKSDWLEVVKAG